MKEKRNIKAQRINTDLLQNIIYLLVTSPTCKYNIITWEMCNVKYIQVYERENRLENLGVCGI
jgi:hypothetical protein